MFEVENVKLKCNQQLTIKLMFYRKTSSMTTNEWLEETPSAIYLSSTNSLY